MKSHEIKARPIPARRHYKYVVESKHKVIRDIYLRLKDEYQPKNEQEEMMIIQAALRISNNLYGNDICSVKELAKGYTRSVENGSLPVKIPDVISEAYKNLIASRKLKSILKYKAVQEVPVYPTDTVQIYKKK